MKSVNKLVLAQMTISKMATIDDIDIIKAEGMRQIAAGLMDAVKIGDSKTAYSYDTSLLLKGLTCKTVIIDNLTPKGTL